MPKISHVSSLSSAASILEKSAIHGAPSSTMASGEAYPHFNHSEYPDGGNVISTPEIKIYFQCSLQELKGGGVSAGYVTSFAPDKLHCQFFNWNPLQPDLEYRFWQAIIHPDTRDPLVFDGYELMDGVTLTKRQRRLFDGHKKAKTIVRPVWHPHSQLARNAGQPPLKGTGILKRLVTGRRY